MKTPMTTAHEIKRRAAAKWECAESEIVFGICLQMAWKGEKIMDNTVSKLSDLGNEWKKGDHHRIYFNNLEKWYGFEFDNGVTLDGEKISKTESCKIIDDLNIIKLWYDVKTGEFAGLSQYRLRGDINLYKREIERAIMSKINP